MMRALRVLVVDDEKLSRQTMVAQLLAAGVTAEACENAFVAAKRLDEAPWDVVVTDLRMPGQDGLTFLSETKRRHPDVDVIVMTAYGTVETAVQAMHGGAADYVTKPFSFPELELRLTRLRASRDARVELARLRALLGQDDSHGILGRSPGIAKVRERIHLFAASAAPVLVQGETGTGKELVARAMHEQGPRREGPFVPVACGAIPAELAESELFGHEKGAFTGAVQRHRGCFEQASGGTLLLDDVDDLPLDIQVKLLRVLQDGTFKRVGGAEQLAVDVRVVATTKVDLARAVESGRFREDLFYRLRGLEVHLPPLRERGDDVLLLAQQFLDALAAKAGSSPRHLTVETSQRLREYAWPGNVRELWRVMESAMTLARGDEILREHLPDFLVTPVPPRLVSLRLDAVDAVDLPAVVEELERELVSWALRKAGGNQSRAAELLNVPRTTLQSKLPHST